MAVTCGRGLEEIWDILRSAVEEKGETASIIQIIRTCIYKSMLYVYMYTYDIDDLTTCPVRCVCGMSGWLHYVCMREKAAQLRYTTLSLPTPNVHSHKNWCTRVVCGSNTIQSPLTVWSNSMSTYFPKRLELSLRLVLAFPKAWKFAKQMSDYLIMHLALHMYI